MCVAACGGALFSGFGTAGQRCTSLGTVIVHESWHDEFLARFSAAVEEAAIGDPFAPVLYGPMLDRRFAERFEEYLGWIRPHHPAHGSPRISRITAAKPRPGFVKDPGAGIFYHPTIVSGVRPDDELFRSETFGPIVGVLAYRDLSEAIRLANLPGYGLSSSTTACPEAPGAHR
ncbi:aldehyde dehydrogenase family protein [Micromonospora sp. B11E3]|uniref:aldehyde dehydrogenase family protein n=1 Tax=Micromonospora sp. B11E3 TaxID=3153562 RepID=UPI00325F120E